MSDEFGDQAASPPRPRDESRLRWLLEILQCPVSRRPLVWQRGGRLATADGAHVWPVRNFRPLLHPAIQDVADRGQHLSHAIAPDAQKVIDEADGLVLNLSAGGTRHCDAKVVEAETAIFRNTDVVADAHALPFKDNSFAAVVALNAFEHYRNPFQVAAEIARVLEPGGRLFIHTAFLQPLHEAPYHFLNATKYGMLEWFTDFTTESVSVPENFSPFFVFGWLAYELEVRLRTHLPPAEADQIMALPLQELVRIYTSPDRWDHPMRLSIEKLPQEAREGIAAGFQYIGRRR